MVCIFEALLANIYSLMLPPKGEMQKQWEMIAFSLHNQDR